MNQAFYFTIALNTKDGKTISNIILLIVGFVLLAKGAGVLVDGASAIARKLNIPEIIIGLTIVACGTSAPEAAVSISSVLHGAAGVGIGNVLGSNVANILLILGISALITDLYIQKNTAHYEIPFVVFVSVLLMYMGWCYGVIYRAVALILFALFLAFLFYLFGLAKKQKSNMPETKNMSLIKMIMFVILGTLALIFGAKLTVDSAVNIAHALNISERVIGLTIIAIGTSLPELVTCVVAAVKKRSDIVVGNIIGSNIFNILFVLGITGLISPIPFESAFFLDAVWGIIAALLLWVFFVKDRKLSRNEGVVFLILYTLYILSLMK